MKNKCLLFLLTIVLLCSMGFTQSITVTSPNGGENWLIGGPVQNITWTQSGITGGTYKISLFKGTLQLGVIAANIPISTLSFPWTVGKLENGTMVAVGPDHKIKVRLQVGTPKDFSDAPFFINKKFTVVSKFEPALKTVKIARPKVVQYDYKPRPDFKIVGMKSIADNSLLVTYTNLGARYVGDLKLWFKIKGAETVITKHAVISKGVHSSFITNRILTMADLEVNSKNVLVEAKIDWNGTTGKVAEGNENNNHDIMAVVPDLGIPDYHPNYLTFVVRKRSSQKRRLPWGSLKLKVKNLGYFYKGVVNIQIRYRFYGESGWPHKFDQETHTLELNPHQEKFLILKDHYWPIRNSTTKEMVWFKVKVVPAPGNPEIILNNNSIEKALHPDGPFN